MLFIYDIMCTWLSCFKKKMFLQLSGWKCLKETAGYYEWQNLGAVWKDKLGNKLLQWCVCHSCMQFNSLTNKHFNLASFYPQNTLHIKKVFIQKWKFAENSPAVCPALSQNSTTYLSKTVWLKNWSMHISCLIQTGQRFSLMKAKFWTEDSYIVKKIPF